MHALVLGGSTFVGRHLVDQLVAGGWDATVLNRGRTASELPAAVGRLVADRTDPASVARALRGRSWDAVFDVSGYVGATDAAGFAALVDLVEGSVGRYVYVSSIMAYRPTGFLPWAEDLPLRDEPPTTYGGLKRFAETLLVERTTAGRLAATVARPAAIYGPRNNIVDMETAMFLRLQQGRPVLLPCHGTVSTSYGHVEDLCATLIVMATHPAAAGEVFNVTGEGATSLQYVRTLAEVVGVEADVRLLPDALLASLDGPACCRLFHPRHHGVLATGKPQAVLGVPQPLGLADGHRRTYDWFRASQPAESGPRRSDPTWGAGFDLAYESQLADRCPSLS